MKRRLFTLALAALTIGLLGSCSKINERIDGLDKRVYDLENNKIASIEQQIATINQSIADLSTIRTNIQTLMDAKTAMGEDITKLKAADQTLEGKINDLKTYVDTELAKYATKDWANATFATLATQKEIITDVEKLKTDLAGLDTKLDQAIANLDSSLKSWVNEQLSGYYTIAQVDAKVDGIQSDIDALETDNETNKTKIEELETKLDQLEDALDDAKTEIKTAYEKAIKDAIEGNDGYITETIKTAIATANGKIDDLTERVGTLESDVATLKNDVAALKAMIQTVSIIPAYSNGSLKAEDGILTINCVITPKKAVESLTKENFTILTSESEVLTKSALYGTLTIAKDEDLVLDKTNGTATIKVDVSSVLPAEEDKALTVAVNIKNGISDFTTEFVPVTATKIPTFKAVYNTNGGANTLTFYYDDVDHSGEGIAVYNNLPTAATKADDWGYNDKRGEIKSVVIDASVAGYTGLTSTASMFQDMATATNISGAEYLDVSNVTDMSFMFNKFGGGKSGSPTTLNVVPDVSQWNTGNVTNMTAMFESYGNFSSSLDKVPDVSGWNTGNVTNMSFMFQKYGHESQNFNAVPDVSKWNTDKVEDMHQMFFEYGHKSTALNTVPDVSKWKTGNVTNMSGMFNGYGYTSTNISCVLDLSGWDLSEITGTNGNNVFAFTPKTFDVTIPAKTGEKSNEGGKWYYGDGTNHIAPPTGKTFTPTITGALKGVFSVSATKKVHFSQGNLVATIDAAGAPTAWKFATHQYDCLGEGGANKTIGATAGDVDLFGWSTSTNGTSTTDNYGIKTSAIPTDYSGDFYDWGKAVGDGNTWRTLSKDEWQYLFDTRTVNGGTKEGKSYQRARINSDATSVYGMILYPDNYTSQTGATSYTSTEWTTMEENGCVFLPAAGNRYVSISNVGSGGYYWSSTVNSNIRGYNVFFNSIFVTPDHYDIRANGDSVRLVTEVK